MSKSTLESYGISQANLTGKLEKASSAAKNLKNTSREPFRSSTKMGELLSNWRQAGILALTRESFPN